MEGPFDNGVSERIEAIWKDADKLVESAGQMRVSISGYHGGKPMFWAEINGAKLGGFGWSVKEALEHCISLNLKYPKPLPAIAL